jgi:hypothetical protein
MRDAILKQKFRTFLDRRATPVHLRDKPEAMKAEIEALLHRLLSLAPRSGYEDWFNLFAEALDDSSQHRTWPSVNEVRGAARLVQKNWRVVDGQSGNVVDMTPAAINLRRLRRGDALGSEWIYGKLAVELLNLGATEAELDAFRSALFFNMREVWGEEKAREVERDLRENHDAALECSGKRRKFATFVPMPGSAAE